MCLSQKEPWFSVLFCLSSAVVFAVERNPASPLQSVSDQSSLSCLLPWHRAPQELTAQRVRDRAKEGTENVPAKGWVPAHSPELHRTSGEAGRETFTRLFLKPDMQGYSNIESWVKGD